MERKGRQWRKKRVKDGLNRGRLKMKRGKC